MTGLPPRGFWSDGKLGSMEATLVPMLRAPGTAAAVWRLVSVEAQVGAAPSHQRGPLRAQPPAVAGSAPPPAQPRGQLTALARSPAARAQRGVLRRWQRLRGVAAGQRAGRGRRGVHRHARRRRGGSRRRHALRADAGRLRGGATGRRVLRGRGRQRRLRVRRAPRRHALLARAAEPGKVVPRPGRRGEHRRLRGLGTRPAGRAAPPWLDDL